jgi:hypothetical protein
MAGYFFLNEPVKVGNLEYTFLRVIEREEIGSSSTYGSLSTKANGIYYVIELSVENVGKDPAYLSSSFIALIDTQERKFDVDFVDAYLGMDSEFKDGKSISFDKLNPGLTQTGYIVFDVPKDIGVHIEVSDSSIFSGKKEVVYLITRAEALTKLAQSN